MISLLINIIFIVFIYIINKKRMNVFTFSLLGLYVAILLGSIGCVYYRVYTWDINFINITLFTLLYLLCICPFFIYNKNLRIQNLTVPSDYKLNIFTYFYIFASIVYIYLSFKVAYNNYLNGDYLAVYEDMRHGNLEKFSSFSEKYTYYIVYHFQYVALIVGFTYYIKNSFWKGTLLIGFSSIAMLLYAIVIVSRTDLFQVVLMLGVCFIFFRPALPTKISKKLIGTITVVGGLFIIIFLLISISRAAYKSDSLWIYNYFGRSILTFNSFMDYMIQSSSTKTFFFDSEASFEIHHSSYTGHEFLALFTRLYSDFDVFGFVLCTLPLFLYPKKRILKIANLFVILLLYRIVILGLMYSSFQFQSSICFLLVYIVTLLWFNGKLSPIHKNRLVHIS